MRLASKFHAKCVGQQIRTFYLRHWVGGVFGWWSQEDLYLFLFILTWLFSLFCHMCFRLTVRVLCVCVCMFVLISSFDRFTHPHRQFYSVQCCSLQWADVRNCSVIQRKLCWPFRNILTRITPTSRHAVNRKNYFIKLFALPPEKKRSKQQLTVNILDLNRRISLFPRFASQHIAHINQHIRENRETTENCSPRPDDVKRVSCATCRTTAQTELCGLESCYRARQILSCTPRQHKGAAVFPFHVVLVK